MNIQKPNAPPMPAQVKPQAQQSPQAKTAPQNSSTQGHKAHHFQSYMSADGRPKEAFHPYRDINAQAAPNSALLARRGIVRPIAMASLPLDPTKRNK